MATRSEIVVVVRRAEGVLVRLLGAVVRRGFDPVIVHAEPGGAPSTLDVAIVVEGPRPAAVLVRHLANLYDVVRVELRGAEGALPPPAREGL